MQRRKILYRFLFVVPVIHFSACVRSEPGTSVASNTPAKSSIVITEAEVNAAQQAWCDGLVKIGKLYKEGGDYKAAASQFIDDAYDFKEGKVFFRPTLAVAPQAFRTTKAGTLAYFVGGDKNFPNDKGFALSPYREIEIRPLPKRHSRQGFVVGLFFNRFPQSYPKVH